MLASSRVISSTGLQAKARRHAHSQPLTFRKPAVAAARAQYVSYYRFARPALGTESAEESSSQQSQPASQETQPGSQEAQPAQPVGEQSLQEKVQGALQALYQNRRLVAVGVAVLDVAFLWLAVKFGKQYFWDPNH